MFGLTNGTNMRGLNEFISDIRSCKDKDSETKRVELELAKIRQKFTIQKGLDAYSRKKYVWKLLYIHILGYEVDFGYQEACGLINSSKYDQKYTGYIACSLLIDEKNQDIWKSIVHSIQSDILSSNEAAQSLALSMIASIVPDILVSKLSDSIIQIATTSRRSTNIRKKAIMCFARILKKYPNKFEIKKYVSAVVDMFQPKSTSLSFLNAASSLLLAMMNTSDPDTFIEAQPKVIRILGKLTISKECSMDYLYYQFPNPWLQMKLFKALQLWSPPSDSKTLSAIQEIIAKALSPLDQSKNVNKNNTGFGLLFEVINLVIHYDRAINGKYLVDASKFLSVFITSYLANTRYLGLQAMCRLAVKHNLSEHRDKIIGSLESTDISIRRRALELLYLICSSQNVEKIVAQLLGYLESKNDPLLLDDLILKIAVLAEKFAQNLVWYVDVIVRLIKNAEIQNDIWYRILQIITGFGQPNAKLQEYAALKLYSAMSVPHVTNTMKCVGSYVISEFSQYLVKNNKNPQKIFDVIHKHFQTANNKSKAMMLNALAKLGVKYEPLRQQVMMAFHMSSQHWDPDVQQRGIQFKTLFGQDLEITKKVLAQNPAYTEEQQQSNPLLKKFTKSAKSMKSTATSSSTIKKSKIQSLEQVSSTNQKNVTSHPLANHPFFKKAIDRLCPNQVNLQDIPGKWELKPYWKQAIVKKTPFEGIQMKQKFQENCLKVILSIAVKSQEVQFKVFRSKGFQVTHSPIKYGPQSQQILLVFTPNLQRIQPPSVGIAWKDVQGQIVKKQYQLPIAINKFVIPTELTYERFNTFYNQFSLASDKYHKLDSFLKVPENVNIPDYLKKIGSFLSSVCNFKCSAHPSSTAIKVLYGSAAFPYKDNGKITKIPLLIEAEGYEINKVSAVRISLRGGNGNLLQSLYQLLIVFL